MSTRALLTEIVRTDQGTFGKLELNGFAFFTCEDDDWVIPTGVYPLRRAIWHGGGGAPVYEIANVPGHKYLYLHWGNTEEDTAHCVLLGLSLGFLEVEKDEEVGERRTKLAVLQSRRAFEKFMAMMGGADDAVIEVRRLAA